MLVSLLMEGLERNPHSTDCDTCHVLMEQVCPSVPLLQLVIIQHVLIIITLMILEYVVMVS